MNLKQTLSITPAWIQANVDFEAAQEAWQISHLDYPFPNALTPWRGTNMPLGTWRVDPIFGEYEVMLHLSPWDVIPGEPEDGIKQWLGYKLYVAWARDGFIPPAIMVVRHVNRQLVSLNRRRVLAARDAMVETLPVWYSDTLPFGRPKWRIEAHGSYWQDKSSILRKHYLAGQHLFGDDARLVTLSSELTGGELLCL